MSVLLETTVGDMVIDLDLHGSPILCHNILKLCKARYYTNTLIYNVQHNRFCQAGDPTGDGSGGASIYGVMDQVEHVKQSKKRFIQSKGRLLSPLECQERGRVVMTEMNGIPNTIGSQFLITIAEGEGYALDGYNPLGEDNTPKFLSLGQVTEDDHGVLEIIHDAYCDNKGRPYADIRIVRALVLHDPFDDPEGLKDLLKRRGVFEHGNITNSPTWEYPLEEIVERRIAADQIDLNIEETMEQSRQTMEAQLRKEDKSRAVVLEMLGDLPDAEITAPENVLFVCKLNQVTQDEDLELIFSRFDQQCKAEIIRDPDSGNSLCYAFIEFSSKKQCVEAYFKMNNALIDDRRIKVDFSQSVAKVWNKFNQRDRANGSKAMPRLDFGDNNHRNGGTTRGRDGVQNRGFLRPDAAVNDRRLHRQDPTRQPYNYHEERSNGNGDYPHQRNQDDRKYAPNKDQGKGYHDLMQGDDIDKSDRNGERRKRPKQDVDSYEKRRERKDSSDDDSREGMRRHKDHRKRHKEERRKHSDKRMKHSDGDKRRKRHDSDVEEGDGMSRKCQNDGANERYIRKKESTGRDDDVEEQSQHKKRLRHTNGDHRRRKERRRHRSRSGDQSEA